MTNTGPQPTSFDANDKVFTGWSNWKWTFFVTYAGSQLTFMTQHEKVIIFRDLRGVTTELHDTAWESDHFSWLTRGHNWPFRCLDFWGFLELPWPPLPTQSNFMVRNGFYRCPTHSYTSFMFNSHLGWYGPRQKGDFPNTSSKMMGTLVQVQLYTLSYRKALFWPQK